MSFHPDPPSHDDAQDRSIADMRARLDALTKPSVVVQTTDQREAEIERKTQERVARALDEVQGRMLTTDEANAVRAMIERDKRVQWLWSSARTMAIWIAAVVAGATVGYDALRTMLKRIVS